MDFLLDNLWIWLLCIMGMIGLTCLGLDRITETVTHLINHYHKVSGVNPLLKTIQKFVGKTIYKSTNYDLVWKGVEYGLGEYVFHLETDLPEFITGKFVTGSKISFFKDYFGLKDFYLTLKIKVNGEVIQYHYYHFKDGNVETVTQKFLTTRIRQQFSFKEQPTVFDIAL